MTELYSDEHRALQDAFDTRPIADVLQAVTVKPVLDERVQAFLASRTFFFLSTVDPSGQPTVSYKGGPPGFVRVLDETTFAFPSYDGNGMFLSMGNIAGDGRVGLLFMDMERPQRVRVHGQATVSRDDPLLAEWPGADLVVRVTVTETFPNCARYIARQTPAAAPTYVPDERGEAPLPAWKKIDALQPFLPARFQVGADEHITAEEYEARLERGES